jgi:hypothetical protein
MSSEAAFVGMRWLAPVACIESTISPHIRESNVKRSQCRQCGQQPHLTQVEGAKLQGAGGNKGQVDERGGMRT